MKTGFEESQAFREKNKDPAGKSTGGSTKKNKRPWGPCESQNPDKGEEKEEPRVWGSGVWGGGLREKAGLAETDKEGKGIRLSDWLVPEAKV